MSEVYGKMFSHEELIEASPELMAFGKVTFNQDWGPNVKKGDAFEQVAIFPEEGKIRFYKEEGDEEPMMECPFKIEYDYADFS